IRGYYRGARPYLVDPPAKPAARFAGRLHLHRVARHGRGQLDAAGARRGLTPFALFAVAVGCLLHRASGIEVVTIGTFFS
ncbi:hypothetical protein AAHH78_39260, partial [Burkholderia pseudomallei]